MPAARGVKRTASKTVSSSSSASGPKNKKKRGGVQLEVPVAPKRRGRVVACGQGDVGQLGLGEDVIETTRYKFVAALGDNIVDICAGGMHSVALDHEGKVWTFGCNDEGALGRATSGETEEGTPTVVSLPKRVVAVTAGDSHSAALLDGGHVYAWGSFRDSHGSMGLVVQGRTGKPCREPVHIDVGEPAAGIASGGDHLVVLTVSGSVFTMGCGEQGQLGRLPQRSASRDARHGFSALLVPAKVNIKSGVSRVWAGYHATFALDAAGEKVLAWGLNNYGQLGITGEKRKTALFSPTECDAFSVSTGWCKFACGQHHSLAVDGEGTCYAVGRCEYGRLGLGDRVGDAESPEPIPALNGKKCISIASGISSSFAVTDNGEVHAWGMGSEGQLGTGNTDDAPAPARITGNALLDRVPLAVSAGGQHSLLVLGSTSEQQIESSRPEQETAEQKPQEKEKVSKRPAKRPRAVDPPLTNTEDHAAPVQKLNGEEPIATPMEVDETDKSEPAEDAKLEPSTESDKVTEKTDQKAEVQQEKVKEPTPDKQVVTEEPVVEEKVTTSPETTKPDEPIVPEAEVQKVDTNDVEMTEDTEKDTVNGKESPLKEQDKKVSTEIAVQNDTSVPTTA